MVLGGSLASVTAARVRSPSAPREPLCWVLLGEILKQQQDSVEFLCVFPPVWLCECAHNCTRVHVCSCMCVCALRVSAYVLACHVHTCMHAGGEEKARSPCFLSPPHPCCCAPALC